MLDDSRSNPAVDYVYTDDEIKSARNKLWEMGNLYWKLDLTQRGIYDFIKGNPKKTTTIVASRRLGKSYTLLILAFEQCLQHPRSIVKFIQPEVKMIVDNIIPTIEDILIDCPPELQPELKKQGNTYTFKNGSRLQLAGTDNQNYNKLRGGNSHLALIDEAGFCSDLKKIINSVLLPTTTLTKGKIILASTMPPDPGHEFIEYANVAETNNTFIKKTIVDAIEENKNQLNPRFTPDILNEIIQGLEAEGGENSDAYRTEYLCLKIHNSDSSVVPEFTPELEKEVVTFWRKPPFADEYTAMDIGFVDMTGLLFAYYDFVNAVLVIEDEALVKGREVTAKGVAELVDSKERNLWTSTVTGEFTPPYKRVSDNNLIFLNDLNQTHGMWFLPTEKHDKNSYINKMRTMVAERRIIINPRCVNLIMQLKNAMWDKTKKDFKRSNGHHFDLVAALAYLVRNLDENRNPFPSNYRYSSLTNNPDKVFFSEQYYKKTGSASSGLSELANKMKPKSSFKKK